MSGGNDDPFLISARVRQKLVDKHNVVPTEVEQCFFNFSGTHFLEDEREDHKTNPPTLWFISETDSGRLLKICFILHEKSQKFAIKSAFDPNQTEIDMFFNAN
ncbi:MULTISPECIES: hypothetical protein [Acinetobacter]|uniref:ADP-ribosyl-(Dinitrogen reductase) hydrolase n=1 Tax=Acinetobacter pittii TaxID=48296 RepID=A0A8I1KYK6_ACIPI|nr:MULTISPECIES: hypothetical protein [Acinetobacter]MDC5166955.1 hypothetical protein [Acinetobacter baumannii]MBK1446834.1 hypothetical protein [Acinetobacter pittii]MCJ9043472.1 hypothetical protein [Acinetobacter pittii]MDC5363698.1 hypothetical protein [Acinetobacter baumannii]USA55684.1 hypothetical protein NDN13_19785 [Acinetobacter sp. C32I]